ncbi:unnamed protein product [Ixodes persulcatus]
MPSKYKRYLEEDVPLPPRTARRRRSEASHARNNHPNCAAQMHNLVQNVCKKPSAIPASDSNEGMSIGDTPDSQMRLAAAKRTARVTERRRHLQRRRTGEPIVWGF